MDPITVVQGIGAVASVIGGLSQKAPGPAIDLGEMRKQALKNGFNPLTVLRATGGAGFTSGVGPSPFSVIGAGISQIGGIMEGQQMRDMGAEAHKAAMDLAKSQTAAFNRPVTAGTGAVMSATADDPMMPLEFSRFKDTPVEEIPYWNVRSIGGDTFQIRGDVLERLGIGEGSTIVTEDWEMMLGELGGEFEGLSAVIKGGLGMNRSDFFKTTGLVEREANPVTPDRPGGSASRLRFPPVTANPQDDYVRPAGSRGRIN